MIVENPEEFKAWMTNVLEPLCDADPEALAKYVYALVKKDKPTEELRKTMLSQLEVFLQEETELFVDLLLKKLQTNADIEIPPQLLKIKQEPEDDLLETVTEDISLSQEDVTSNVEATSSPIEPTIYVNTDLESELLGTSSEDILDSSTSPVKDVPSPPYDLLAMTSTDTDSQEEELDVSEQAQTPVLPEVVQNGNSTNVDNKVPEGERRLSSSRSYDRKSDTEKDERRRQRSSSPNRRGDRSRSRSWERRGSQRRSRSRSRRTERDRSRAWRNKSPPSRPRSRGYDRDRKFRSWSKSPPPRSRSRSPPPKMRSRYRKRSPLGRSRSRSQSPYDSPRMTSRGGTPTQDSNHGEDFRSQSSQLLKDSRKRRCRDFDEKGFCMRGELCPFDHGTDPVVLEDVGQVLSFSGPGAAVRPPLPPPPMDTGLPPATPGMPMAVPMLQPPMAMHRPMMHHINRPPPNLSEYNPDAPSMEPRMWAKQPYRMPGRGMMRGMGPGMLRPPPMFGPHHQRELIRVPVMEGEERQFYGQMGNPLKRSCPQDFMTDSDMLSSPKQRFDYTRLGMRRGSCSLQLKKVPPGLNNIAHLHNHFVKFGKIVNIQVCFGGDPEASLITFMSHAEASAAFKSTEAVLNNRFIRVLWYNADSEGKQENIQVRPSVKDRLGAPVQPAQSVGTGVLKQQSPSSNEPISGNDNMVITINPDSKPVYAIPDKKTFLKKQEAKKMLITANFNQEIQLANAKDVIKKRQEDKRKEALKLKQHLFKKKGDLINKLLESQNELIEKVEKGNITPEQRAEIMATIKGFQENIEIVRKDMETVGGKTTNTTAPKITPQAVKKSREETQKEILDAELDLINQQQEGKDTSELQKRVLELKTKALNLGMLTNKMVHNVHLARGGTRFRSFRGRGGYNPQATVDHRPTKLLVSGFESDDKAEVIQHFSKFGEVVDHIWDEATPALVIQYKSRKDAEVAMAKGRNFQDRLMSVTWFNQAQTMGLRGPTIRSVILLGDNVNDLLSEHDEEEEALRINLDSNEDFLLQEDEDDEDEERSWRR